MKFLSSLPSHLLSFLPLNLVVMLMTILSAPAISHNSTYQHRTGAPPSCTHMHTCMHSVTLLLGTCAEVQIEKLMCANAFRTEVRLALPFPVSQQWEHQPQYGKLERRAYYSA